MTNKCDCDFCTGKTKHFKCYCDFCTGRKLWEDNWCSRCGDEKLKAGMIAENMDICDECMKIVMEIVYKEETINEK